MSRAGQRQPQRGNRSSLTHRVGLRGAGRRRLPKASRRCSAPWPKQSCYARSNRNQKPADGGAARTSAIFFRGLGERRRSERGLPLMPPPASSCRKRSTGCIGSTATRPTAANMAARPIPPGIIFHRIPSLARAFPWPMMICPHLRARNKPLTGTRTKPMPSAASARSMAAILNVALRARPLARIAARPSPARYRYLWTGLLPLAAARAGFCNCGRTCRRRDCREGGRPRRR